MDTNDSDLPDPELPDDDLADAPKRKPKPALIAAVIGAVAVIGGGGWYVASGGLRSPEERCNAARIEAREAWVAYGEASRSYRETASPAIRDSLAAFYSAHPTVSTQARMYAEVRARGMGSGPGPGPDGARRLAERALRAHATEAWQEVQRLRPAEPTTFGSAPPGDEETPEWLGEDEDLPSPRWPQLDDAAVRAALATAIERSEASYEACRLVDP